MLALTSARRRSERSLSSPVRRPSFFSNIELDWELQPRARFLEELASFARLIQFDRRGAGMSGGVAGATPLEEQIDDVRAVLDAAGSEQPALISIAEGCALAVLFAASHPSLVRALVLITPTPRVVRGPGYEWAQSVEERDAIVHAVVEHWGSGSPDQPWGAFAGQDEERRRLLARHRRLSITPDAAAASLAMVGELEVSPRRRRAESRDPGSPRRASRFGARACAAQSLRRSRRRRAASGLRGATGAS
jgi:pimeloyl-ACP methyl ester carboxylesterase